MKPHFCGWKNIAGALFAINYIAKLPDGIFSG
jgi:hypothetical protein